MTLDLGVVKLKPHVGFRDYFDEVNLRRRRRRRKKDWLKSDKVLGLQLNSLGFNKALGLGRELECSSGLLFNIKKALHSLQNINWPPTGMGR